MINVQVMGIRVQSPERLEKICTKLVFAVSGTLGVPTEDVSIFILQGHFFGGPNQMVSCRLEDTFKVCAPDARLRLNREIVRLIQSILGERHAVDSAFLDVDGATHAWLRPTV